MRVLLAAERICDYSRKVALETLCHKWSVSPDTTRFKLEFEGSLALLSSIKNTHFVQLDLHFYHRDPNDHLISFSIFEDYFVSSKFEYQLFKNYSILDILYLQDAVNLRDNIKNHANKTCLLDSENYMATAIDWLIQIASVLVDLHSVRLAHGRLSTNNIFVPKSQTSAIRVGPIDMGGLIFNENTSEPDRIYASSGNVQQILLKKLKMDCW